MMNTSFFSVLTRQLTAARDFLKIKPEPSALIINKPTKSMHLMEMKKEKALLRPYVPDSCCSCLE